MTTPCRIGLHTPANRPQLPVTGNHTNPELLTTRTSVCTRCGRHP